MALFKFHSKWLYCCSLNSSVYFAGIHRRFSLEESVFLRHQDSAGSLLTTAHTQSSSTEQANMARVRISQAHAVLAMVPLRISNSTAATRPAFVLAHFRSDSKKDEASTFFNNTFSYVL